MYLVYALLKGKEIVYIGRCKGMLNLKQRLYSHKRTGKVFSDYVYKVIGGYEACKKEESRLIKDLLPKYNKQGIVGRVNRHGDAYFTKKGGE